MKYHDACLEVEVWMSVYVLGYQNKLLLFHLLNIFIRTLLSDTHSVA